MKYYLILVKRTPNCGLFPYVTRIIIERERERERERRERERKRERQKQNEKRDIIFFIHSRSFTPIQI